MTHINFTCPNFVVIFHHHSILSHYFLSYRVPFKNSKSERKNAHTVPTYIFRMITFIKYAVLLCRHTYVCVHTIHIRNAAFLCSFFWEIICCCWVLNLATMCSCFGCIRFSNSVGKWIIYSFMIFSILKKKYFSFDLNKYLIYIPLILAFDRGDVHLKINLVPKMVSWIRKFSNFFCPNSELYSFYQRYFDQHSLK